MKVLLRMPIIKIHIEAASGGNNVLMQVLVGMPAPCRTAWNIVQVVNTLDGKRNVSVALDECQIA